MRLDPGTRAGSLGLAIAVLLLRALFALLSRTWRLHGLDGEPRLAELLAARQPVILSFWHNRSLISAWFLRRCLIAHGHPVTLLASQSRDGELVARMARGWRVAVVRGSATRGGRAAIRQVYKALVKDGSSPVMIPDGPHGPLYEFKLGVAVLAQLSGAPIQPLGFSADRAWRIRSWDRLIVPKPFARLAVVVGEPQRVDRELEGTALEGERRRLETFLTDLTHRAESVFEGDGSPAAG